MKIGIYNQPSVAGINGVECSAAVLAEKLRDTHQVDIIHHHSPLSIDQLAEFYGTELVGVTLRQVDREAFLPTGSRNPWTRYQEARGWCRSLSERYDVFINFSADFPPFCHARHGILRIVFPLMNLPHVSTADRSPDRASLVDYAKRLYHGYVWKRRLDSYQMKIANSRFTSIWAARRWGIQCHVLHSPADTCFRTVEKSNSVLSVGRFATGGTNKNQLEMVNAFRQIQPGLREGWEYHCVGPLGDWPPDLAYFNRARHLGDGFCAHLLASPSRFKLRELYEHAKIFWHAAGYGVDENVHPELTEHFGVTTIEAMAAGAVPIVINKGGQPEIVQHGVTGFLWNTLNELKAFTLLLMHDDNLRKEMSEKARLHAQSFGRDAYANRLITLWNSAGYESIAARNP